MKLPERFLKADPDVWCRTCDKVRRVCRHCDRCHEHCPCPVCEICDEFALPDVNATCQCFRCSGCLGKFAEADAHYPDPDTFEVLCAKCNKERS